MGDFDVGSLGSKRLSLLGLGYPLIDLVARIKDAHFLLRHGLDSTVVIAPTEHNRLYKELVDEKCGPLEYTAGGSTLNTIRVSQWLLSRVDDAGYAGATAFIGRVGRDDFGARLRGCIAEDGITPLLEEAEVGGGSSAADEHGSNSAALVSSSSTGASAVLVLNGERTLVTYLGASRGISHAHIDQPHVWAAVRTCKILYTCGFMCQAAAPNHFDIAIKCARAAREQGNMVAVNLSAVYICKEFTERLCELLRCADVAVGNEEEALALGQAMHWTSKADAGPAATPESEADVTSRLVSIAGQILLLQAAGRCGGAAPPSAPLDQPPGHAGELHSRAHGRRLPLTALIARGPKPTILARCQSEPAADAANASSSCCVGGDDIANRVSITHTPAEPLPASAVIDGTCAGDAFAGGFLAGVILGKDAIRCVRIGNWAAAHVIQRLGATFDRDAASECPYLKLD